MSDLTSKLHKILSIGLGKVIVTNLYVNHKERCTGCPHGPYKVIKYRDDKTVRSIYLGRDIPDEIQLLLNLVNK